LAEAKGGGKREFRRLAPLYKSQGERVCAQARAGDNQVGEDADRDARATNVKKWHLIPVTEILEGLMEGG
jgi:hypothetical protein